MGRGHPGRIHAATEGLRLVQTGPVPRGRCADHRDGPSTRTAPGNDGKAPPRVRPHQGAALAFLRDELDREHDAYKAARRVRGFKHKAKRRPAPTPKDVLDIRDALPAEVGAVWWSMASSGMGPGELDGDWSIVGNTIEINGTKREGRVRTVPYLGGGLTRRSRGWEYIRDALRPMGREPYDARRAFAHLMEEAGIPRTRRKQYMGHKATDDLDGYETADLPAYIAADREQLLIRLAQAEATRADRRREGLRRA